MHIDQIKINTTNKYYQLKCTNVRRDIRIYLYLFGRASPDADQRCIFYLFFDRLAKATSKRETPPQREGESVVA